MLRIIDVASYTTLQDREAVKEYDGVIIKATEGGTYINPNLEMWVDICRQYKKPFGFYHFAGKVHTALQEYTFFKSVVSKYPDRILPDILDYELAEEDTNFCLEFLRYDTSMLFYSAYLFSSRMIANGLSQSRIWCAIPNHSTLNTSGFIGVQYALDTNVHGIDNVDISIFDDNVLHHSINLDNIERSVSLGVMAEGERSNRVRLIQSIFNVISGAGLTVDGIFGQDTKQAVINYQRVEGITADGIVGTNTINTLLNDLTNNWFKIC
jgi:hypothetical protein